MYLQYLWQPQYGCTQKKKLNQIFIIITLAVVPKHDKEWRGPNPAAQHVGNTAPKKRPSGGEQLAAVRPI